MIDLFTVSSVILGFIAWALPVINIILSRRRNDWNWGMLSALSLSACAISIWFLYQYTNHKVNVEDWSALLDTTDTINQVTGVLLLGTLVLNLTAYIVDRKKTAK